MNEEFQQYEEIEAYLRGDLQGSNLIDFEQKLQNNADFAQEVEYHQMAQSFIVEKRLLSIEEHCQELRPKKKSFSWKKTSLLIAILSIVSASSYWIYSSTQQIDNQKKSVVEVPNSSSIIINEVERANSKKEIVNNNTPSYTSIDKKVPQKETENKVISLQIKDEKIQKEKIEEVQLKDDIQEEIVTLQPKIIEDNYIIDSAITIPEVIEENPCHDVHISMNCTTYDACDNIADGKLIIAETKGGAAPYQYSLDKKHYYQMTEFGGLVEGHYIVWVKDKNGCIIESDRAVQIKSKECKEPEEFLLNPLEEFWEIPFDSDQDAILKIIDTQGTIVYSLKMNAQTDYEWDGRSLQGAELSLGMYVYLIEYHNGSIDKGYITLVR